MWLPITCTLFVLTVVNAAPATSSEQQHRCGRYLRETLAVVCKGKGYYGRDKKDYLDNRRHNNYIVRRIHKRQQSQIVDECCKRSCSIETLKMYCNDDILQDTSAQMSTSAELFLNDIKINHDSHTSTALPTLQQEHEPQKTTNEDNAVPSESAGLGETEANEDDYSQSFGSYNFPDKQKYKFVWAVLYDDQNQNNNNYHV